MKVILLITILSVLVSCNLESIQGSNKLITKNYDLTDFDCIDASSAFEIELIQSDEFSVKLECNENLEEYVEIIKNDNCIEIGMKEFNNYSNTTLKVIISAPSINHLEASGACEIIIDEYKVDNFEFDLSGASDVDGKLIVSEKLTIEASGASDIKLRGKTKNLDIDFSGASEFSGKKLIVSNALTIESSGASSVTVTANGTLDIDCSGASDVIYYGEGEVIRNESSGASSVRKK